HRGHRGGGGDPPEVHLVAVVVAAVRRDVERPLLAARRPVEGVEDPAGVADEDPVAGDGGGGGNRVGGARLPPGHQGRHVGGGHLGTTRRAGPRRVVLVHRPVGGAGGRRGCRHSRPG